MKPDATAPVMNSPPPKKRPDGVPVFGANEVRLNALQWVAALAILAAAIILTPVIWGRVQRIETGPDYRIPYSLSNDYWLYGQRLRREIAPDRIFMVGDSVIWGEYVSPDGTWSHFLNRESGMPGRFVNAGVNGLFPLALDGLVRYHGQALRRQKVILHCNLLWMASAKADLSTKKATTFNHSRLVPQFRPRIPCYRPGEDRNTDIGERLSAIVERNVDFIAWSSHLQYACFDQKNIPDWTLNAVVSADKTATNYPNVYRNPLARISLTVPSASTLDPDRGPASPRHKPWSTNGAETLSFAWVPLEESLQWQAFQRLVAFLQGRGNEVLVILGPFNEHMMTEENRPAFRKLRDGVAAWLAQNRIPHVVPETLPSLLYADASHPLTEGYELLARQVSQDETLRTFCKPATP